MLRRYALYLNVPDPRVGHWTTAHLGNFATIERALRRSEEVLAKHPSVETRARAERWPYFCSLYDRKAARGYRAGRGDGRKRGAEVLVRLTDTDNARLEAQRTIVPSVGELGWTP
jgi:hypothetical protein